MPNRRSITLPPDDENWKKSIKSSLAVRMETFEDLSVDVQKRIEMALLPLVIHSKERDYFKSKAEKSSFDNDIYKAAIQSISAVLEFRQLLETYEYQFTAQAPDHIKPGGIDKNFYTKFNNRVLRWQWILKNSTDPRAVMLNTKLTAFNAVDNFCVMVSSLYIICSKTIHLPGAQRLQPHEMREKLIDAGIALDDWSQAAVNIILFDIPSVSFLSQPNN